MAGKVTIKHLGVGEWRNYKELRLRALQSDPQAFGQSYEAAEGKPDSYWIKNLQDSLEGRAWLVFAEAEGKLIGMLGASVHSDEPNRVWLHATFVDPEYRGRGISKMLMDSILNEISESSAPKIVKLGVSVNQGAALALYKRAGFTIIGEEDYTMGNGELVHEFIMEKHL